MVQLDTFQIDGRVLSLLELSGGFDTYLTGRENVIRTTEFLGFPDGYALERMDQVKEFSELGVTGQLKAAGRGRVKCGHPR